MAERPRSSSVEPLKAKPEVISTPPKGRGASADKAAASPVKEATSSETTPEPAENASFANTRQHVADRQKDFAATERFTNTKQNIALINDPKNGPRFTLTKKESGHVEQPGTKPAPPATDKPGSDHGPKAPNDPTTGANRKPGNPTPAPASATPRPEVAAVNEAVGSAGARQQEAPSSMRRPPGPSGVPPAAEPPSKVPIDSSKTFVGPNGTYYDESWRWMDWRGTKRSWNWPAACSFGHWLAYRRLYWQAGLYILWLAALTAALVNNVHVGLVAGLLILGLVLTGQYANTLYFLAFRRAVAHVTEKGEGSYDELKRQLARAGGVSAKAPWFMASLTTIAIALVLFATFYERGAFLINLWPF